MSKSSELDKTAKRYIVELRCPFYLTLTLTNH